MRLSPSLLSSSFFSYVILFLPWVGGRERWVGSWGLMERTKGINKRKFKIKESFGECLRNGMAESYAWSILPYTDLHMVRLASIHTSSVSGNLYHVLPSVWSLDGWGEIKILMWFSYVFLWWRIKILKYPPKKSEEFLMRFHWIWKLLQIGQSDFEFWEFLILMIQEHKRVFHSLMSFFMSSLF